MALIMLTFNSEFNGLKGPHCRIQTSHKKFINPILPGREIEFKHQADKNKSRSALFSVSNLCYVLSVIDKAHTLFDLSLL